MVWPSGKVGLENAPRDRPLCGFSNELCKRDGESVFIIIISMFGIINVRENVHQVGSILFETNFTITQLAMLDLLLSFDHRRRPSSGTDCSMVAAR